MPAEFPAARKDSWSQRRGISSRLKCTILAAGLGKRLEPLTARHLPKPLFPLGGKLPLAEIWVQRMVESGITDISLNLCVLASAIRRHFGDGSRFGAHITYVEEKTPSGTLGGVCKQALGRDAKVLPGEAALSAEPFRGSTIIAPSGDIVTDFSAASLEEMYDIHVRAGASFTMILVPIPWDRRKDFGTVTLADVEQRPGLLSKSGQITSFLEKDPNSPSNLNNASIYMLEMDLLRELDALRTPAALGVERPFYDFGKHVFPSLLNQLTYAKTSRNHRLWGIQYDGAWFDVGQKRDYLDVNRQLLDGHLKLELPLQKMPWGYLGQNVVMDATKVNIAAPAVIGSHCTIEPGATIGPQAILGDGWTVEKGATIRDSVLWEKYPCFDEQGIETATADQSLGDPRRIRAGIRVERSIVAGGDIQQDVRDSTVHVAGDGRLTVLPIDYIPAGPRA